MNVRLMLCAVSLSLAATAASAAPVLTVGVPGDSLLSTPTKPSPAFGTLTNFDSLAPSINPVTTLSTNGNTFTSPDGLEVIPFSTQSGPNELYDTSADGTANLTITFANGEYKVGIGIADSDPVSITLQALGLNGLALGSPFTESLAATESAINTGNGYYVITDTTADIYGLKITETSGNANLYSGLAIDDLQTATTPEPSSFVFLAEGICALGAFARFRRFKKA